MSKGTTSQDALFGTLLGYARWVAIYSSDYSSLDPQEYEDDAVFRSYIDDEYMGHKWQCVEFARRFLFLNYGVVFTDVGMAWRFSRCASCEKWLMTTSCHCRHFLTARRVRRSRVRFLSGIKAVNLKTLAMSPSLPNCMATKSVLRNRT